MSTEAQVRPFTLDPAECWTVVERVAASPALKRAARLREFLLYVGAQSLKEGRSQIREQEIGETVFGRPRSYDTSQDNIVRVSATELRKRVEAYFAAEGIAEPLIFEIPRGSYAPTFRLRTPLPLPASSAAEPSRPASVRNLTLWIVSAIAVLLAVCCVLQWRQNAALRQHIQMLEHQHSQLVVEVSPHFRS